MSALLRAVITAGLVAGVAAPATAASCIKVGGWGTGVTEGFASFMANAALKNSAKKWGGETVKISKVSEKCQSEGLTISCNTRARACK